MPDLYPRAVGEPREARDEDAQDLFGLLSLCFAEYPGCYIDPHDDLPDLVRPGRSFAQNDGVFWVVEDDRGRVGGCIACDRPEPDVVELHRLYVRPDLRRQGLGARLVQQAEERAEMLGARTLILWSDTRFLDAHQFYEKLGYVRDGVPRQLGDISNSAEFHFIKRLEPPAASAAPAVADSAGGISIRPARPTELERIVALHAADDIGQHGDVWNEHTAAAYRQAFDRLSASPSHAIFVALIGGDIVGTFVVSILPSLTGRGATRAVLRSVQVDAAHRSRGIGARMVAHAEDFARSQGAKAVELTSNKARPDAHRFYLRAGYAMTHEGFKKKL